jgi:hypothetical protein
MIVTTKTKKEQLRFLVVSINKSKNICPTRFLIYAMQALYNRARGRHRRYPLLMRLLH